MKGSIIAQVARLIRVWVVERELALASRMLALGVEVLISQTWGREVGQWGGRGGRGILG